MKKIFIFIFMSVFLFSIEKDVYVGIKKQTNGNYILELPTVETEENFDNYTEYTKISLLFSAPREDIKSANHYSIESDKTFEINKNGFYISFSFGFSYYFKENCDNIPEGFDFNNKLKFGYRDKKEP